MRMHPVKRAAAMMLSAAVTAAFSGCTGSSSEPAAGQDAPPVTQAAETAAPENQETAPAVTEAAAPVRNEADVRGTIPKVSGEPDWSAVNTLELDQILWEPDCGIRAFAQLAYDDERLYVHLRAVEKDIRAENTELLSPVYQDSCLEFFFMPENETRYFNFEINPNGCLYCGFGHGRKDSTALARGDFAELFRITSDRTDDGWEVFYSIPLEYLQLFCPDFAFEGGLRANFYKCGDKTAQKHYLAWNKVNSEKPDYHRPEDFGLLVFG